jgi:signal transduction histidine kinase/DNA-binding response OmpR family regulator
MMTTGDDKKRKMKADIGQNARTPAFESILMRIATEFINVDPEDFDEVLSDAFELVGLFFDVDRIYVFEYDFVKRTTSNTYEWCNQGISKEIDNLKNIPLTGLFDDWISYHMKGEAVNISDVSKLDHKSQVYQTLAPQGIMSVLTLPLIDKKNLLGFVGFDDNRRTRIWDEREFQLLKVLAEMITNILIRQQIEADLIKAREQAMNANEARGKFLANISHEMRTPLSGIHNAIYLLQTTQASFEQKQYLKIAETSIETLSGIVNDVLDLSKIDAGKMDVFNETFDIEEELVKVLTMQAYQAAEKGLDLTLDFDYGIDFEVIGDVQKFRQIVLNILSNAVKYTEKGFVHVRVDHEDRGSTIDLTVTIQDSGIGIAKEDHERIFELFYRSPSQLSRDHRGSGLGLPITHEFIKLLGGKLNVESDHGSGSTFQVDLTFVKGKRHDFLQNNVFTAVVYDEERFSTTCQHVFASIGFRLIKKSSQAPRKVDVIIVNTPLRNEADLNTIKSTYAKDDTLIITSCHGPTEGLKSIDLYFEYPIARKTIHERLMRARDDKRIEVESTPHLKRRGNVLIVDDNFTNRLALSRILLKHGYSNKHVESGKEAIEEVRRNAYDVILMDIQMPGLDGYETAKHIRALGEKGKRIPIIAVTANIFADDAALISRSGMNGILHKPIQVDRVLMELDHHMEKIHMFDVPEDVPIFDQQDFQRLYEGSDDIGSQVIMRFLEDVDRDLAAIEKTFINKNDAEIYRALHYFKGSVGYVSGRRVMWLLNRMLAQTSEHDVRVFDRLRKAFKQEVEMLKERLKARVTRD